MEIIVEKIVPVNRDSAQRAYIDVRFKSGMLIRDFVVVQETGKSPWVACPQVSWTAANGKICRKTIVEFPKDAMAQLQEKILDAWKTFANDGGKCHE